MPRVTKSKLVLLQKRYKTDAKIGEEFGITRQAIHQLRKLYGIPSLRIHNDKRNKEIVRQYKAGNRVDGIAKKFKLSIPQVYQIIRKSKNRGKKAAKKKATRRKK